MSYHPEEVSIQTFLHKIAVYFYIVECNGSMYIPKQVLFHICEFANNLFLSMP